MEFNTVGLLIEDLNNKRIIELKNHNRDAESVYSYFLSVAKKVEKDGGNYDEVIKAFRKEEKSLREILGFDNISFLLFFSCLCKFFAPKNPQAITDFFNFQTNFQKTFFDLLLQQDDPNIVTCLDICFLGLSEISSSDFVFAFSFLNCMFSSLAFMNLSCICEKSFSFLTIVSFKS